MAAMSNADRITAARNWVQRIFVEAGQTANMDGPAIKAAVDAVDDWVDANQTSFNTALPEPFKSTANLAQKSLLLAYVVMRRAGIV